MDLDTSTLPDGKWKMVWHDEFEGTELDPDKWLYREHRFGAVVPQWSRDAVNLRDGHLELTAFEKDGEYYCGAIQTGANSMDKPKQKLCWHNYGVEWTKEVIIFYVDGKESWRTSAAIPHCPQFLLLTTEIQGAKGGQQKGNRIKQAVLPDRFMVDHVRVFDRIS